MPCRLTNLMDSTLWPLKSFSGGFKPSNAHTRDSESKAVGGRLSLEEQQTFGGLTRQAGTLVICPELLDHVKVEVERDANLANKLRKAREERDLARKQGKKKGEDAP